MTKTKCSYEQLILFKLKSTIYIWCPVLQLSHKKKQTQTRNISVMNSTAISVPSEDEASLSRGKKTENNKFFLFPALPCSVILKKGTFDPKLLIHSIKAGIAFVLVSLLYLVDALYKDVGENAMWAMMTVVVVFDFTAGATLSKSFNRGMGTILGGGLGCLAAILAQEIGGIGRAIAVGMSVFIFGKLSGKRRCRSHVLVIGHGFVTPYITSSVNSVKNIKTPYIGLLIYTPCVFYVRHSGAAASYTRMVPRIKKKYDYGFMILILTFNLVVVSGHRSEEIIQLARERLSTIAMGILICIFTSLVIFPVWASDELHCSIATKFDNLATSIEGCLEEYFKSTDENKENQVIYRCTSVLDSKSKDEILANFARWEPWHGRFGLYHPWDKYLCIGELLRELAALNLSLKGWLLSPQQPSLTHLRLSVKEPSEEVASLIASTMRELGDSIINMTRCTSAELIAVKLQSKRLELRLAVCASKPESQDTSDELEMASLVFLLMQIIIKVENLAKEVEKLGNLAGFLPK